MTAQATRRSRWTGGWLGLRIVLAVVAVALPALLLRPGPAVADPVGPGVLWTPSPPWATPTPTGLCTEGVTARCPAGGAGTYTVDFDSEGARYWYIVCLKSDTTMKRKAPNDRVCTKKADGIAAHSNWTFFITVDYTEGDKVYVDFEMFITTEDSRTVNDIDLAGAHNCDFNGLVSNGRFWCDEWKDNPPQAMTYSMPPIQPYSVDVEDEQEPIMQLINLMGWSVSAAAVAGLLIAGAQMAMQLRRGVAGERANEYIRPLSLICAACLLASTAGPIVEFFGFDQDGGPPGAVTTTPTPTTTP